MKSNLLFVAVTASALAFAAARAELPPLPPQTAPPLPAVFDYADDDAARAVWKPMDGTAPVSVVQAGARQAVHLPCNFAGTDIERASWDWSVKLDLTRARGIHFRFACTDPSPVSHFVLYLHSGEGWYTASFSPDEAGVWDAIRVGKADTRMEGAPAGWARIDTVRVSAWRGGDEDTECYIADFGVWEGSAPVAVISQESAILEGHSEGRAIEKAAQLTANLLDELGLPYTVLSDLDIAAADPDETKVIVLPYCPAQSRAAAAALAGFAGRGGKIVSFYTLSPKLLPALGFKEGRHIKQERKGYFASIRPSDEGLADMPPLVKQASWNIGEVLPLEGSSRAVAYWYDDEGKATGHAAILASDNCVHMTHILLDDDRNNKRLMLLSMIAHFVPEYWELAATQSLEQAGAIGPYANFAEAREAMAACDPAPPEVAKAEAMYGQAEALIKDGEYAAAIATAGLARDEMLLAYCGAQQPKEGEHRAFWCHSPFGVTGMTWDEAIANLADNGFTAILPNMLWGGTAYYESGVLPVSAEIEEKGDQIALCLAACKKHGIACHVWKVNWNMGSYSPGEFVADMKGQGRTQVMFDGTQEERWLCPSHPLNQQLEIESMVEVATKYDVDGVHFDYIRYPHGNACYCEGCRGRFEKAIGAEVAGWPGGVRDDRALYQKWLGFRRDQITGVVAAVAGRVRAAKPGVKISAAVFRNWPRDRDMIGQDWGLWCEKGYLDFVCPMDYVPHAVHFENAVRRQLEWVSGVPCYPGIGLTTWPDPGDIVGLIEQIEITRRLGAGGFTIFNYGVSEAERIVPLCGKGITKRRDAEE